MLQIEEIIDYIQYLRREIPKEPQCAGVFMLLAMRFRDAECYYNSDHIITKIGVHCYDWNGLVIDKKGYTPMERDYGDPWMVAHYNILSKNEK